MKQKLLAVCPESLNYHSHFLFTAAQSFEEAKALILQAEEAGEPFDALDLPVSDRRAFDEFFEWMAKTHRKYPFSIFGYHGFLEFMQIKNRADHMGFSFRD